MRCACACFGRVRQVRSRQRVRCVLSCLYLYIFNKYMVYMVRYFVASVRAFNKNEGTMYALNDKK